MAIAVAVAACSTSSGNAAGGADSGSPTSTSVTGTAGGQSLGVKDTVGLYSAGNASTVPYVGAIVTNFAASCTLFQSGGKAPPSTQLLNIEVLSFGSTAPAPGTYAYGNADAGVAILVQYVATDASCSKTIDESAMTGSVTLDSVSATEVAGTFDVTFPGGDRLTGQFAGPVCNVDLSALGQMGGGCLARDP
jgi:hypothetical protein